MSKPYKTMRDVEYKDDTNLFRYPLPYRWGYIGGWFKNIRAFFRRFKWAYQRAKYGFSEADCWDFGEYLGTMLPKALNYYAEHADGYPNEYESFDEWKAEVMICGDRIALAKILWNKEYNVDWKNGEKFPIEEAKKDMREAEEQTREAFRWLGEHLWSIWD